MVLLQVMENDDQLNQYKKMEKLLEQTHKMLFRWREGRMIKHMDLDVYERTIRNCLQLERQLVITQNTIEVLSNSIQKNEQVLKHFNEEDLVYLRRRIRQRKEREERAQLEIDSKESL